MAIRRPHGWPEIRHDWPLLSVYERFESLVSLLLTLIISTVILVALARLVVSVLDTLVLRSLNPLEHGVFQNIFGEILTLLIALEFNHTLHVVIRRQLGIIQVRIVILIALLALVRKVIVTELSAFPPAGLAALAGLILALGVTYWLMGERDNRRFARRGRSAPTRVPSGTA